MSLGARAHALNFSWDKTAQKTLAVYNQVIQGGASAFKVVQ